MKSSAAADGMDTVQLQYERLPYPDRKPEDEGHRLVSTWLDDLRMINHHCFRGERRFENGFRVLVAGGGTGDGTIFLAEQLRQCPTELIHLDISKTAIKVAQQRAAVRGLTNIRFVEASLLELPRLALGHFDYINCVGVLHHLADPAAGLATLVEQLASDGAMALLLYATYGRTGVYQLQALLRMINGGATETVKLENARAVLGTLPPTNWFRRGEDLHRDHREGGDAGLYDLLLHSRDRSYSVTELYEWFGALGLHVYLSDWQRGRLPYDPAPLLTRASRPLSDRITSLPVKQQHAIAELMRGDIITHSFYATRSTNGHAPYGNVDYVPVLINERDTGEDFARLIKQHNSMPFLLQHAQSGLAVPIDPGHHVGILFRHLDGKRTFREIFDRVRSEMGNTISDSLLFEEFKPWYQALESIERLILRKPECYAGLPDFTIA